MFWEKKKKSRRKRKRKEEKQDGTVRLQWSDLKIWFQVSPECPEGAHSGFWPSVQFSVVHDKNPHKDLAKDSVFVHKNLVQQGPHRARCQHVIVGQERDNTLCQKCHCDSLSFWEMETEGMQKACKPVICDSMGSAHALFPLIPFENLVNKFSSNSKEYVTKESSVKQVHNHLDVPAPWVYSKKKPKYPQSSIHFPSSRDFFVQEILFWWYILTINCNVEAINLKIQHKQPQAVVKENYISTHRVIFWDGLLGSTLLMRWTHSVYK